MKKRTDNILQIHIIKLIVEKGEDPFTFIRLGEICGLTKNTSRRYNIRKCLRKNYERWMQKLKPFGVDDIADAQATAEEQKYQDYQIKGTKILGICTAFAAAR